MIWYKDFTALVHGVTDDITQSVIDAYQAEGINIVASTWVGNTPLTLNGDGPGTLIRSALPEEIGDNLQNAYYQTASALNGIQRVTTKYVIKVRSSRYAYTRPLSALRMFLDHDGQRMVSSSAYFRPNSLFPYHASDHFTVCETAVLWAALDELERGLMAHKWPTELAHEGRLTECLLHASGERELLAKDAMAIMSRHFDIIPVWELVAPRSKLLHLAREADVVNSMAQFVSRG